VLLAFSFRSILSFLSFFFHSVGKKLTKRGHVDIPSILNMVSHTSLDGAKHCENQRVDCTRTGSLLKCFPELSRDTVDNPFNREDDFRVTSRKEKLLSAPACAAALMMLQHWSSSRCHGSERLNESGRNKKPSFKQLNFYIGCKC